MILLQQDTLKIFPEFVLSNDTSLAGNDLLVLVQKLAIALLIGLLIGIEREFSRIKDEKTFAGIRTFPLIALLGAFAALIASITSFWTYVGFFLGYSALITSSYIFSARSGRPGGTSEITSLLTFMLGSLVYWNFIIIAAASAVTITIFLSLKIQLHDFVGKLSGEDIFAALKLAVISIIVLPLLPDEAFGPLNVLNPHDIWLMVILVSGISFIGYLFVKFGSRNEGIPLTGLMGGLVSSTAVTFSFSRKSRGNPALAESFAAAIILASTVMYARVFLIISIINFSLIHVLWFPLALFSITGIFVSRLIWKKAAGIPHEHIELKNPFELKSALAFGIMFAAVIFLSKAAQVYLGYGGLFAASAAAGLTSVDAIIIAVSKLADEVISYQIAAVAVIISLITNNLVKLFIALSLGAKEMRLYIWLGLGSLTVVSVVYLAIVLVV